MKKLQIVSLFVLLLALSCGSLRKSSKDSSFVLESTAWQVEELNGDSFDAEDDKYTLRFNEEGRISGKGECNVIMGGYAQSEGGKLKFSQMATTRSMCPNMDVEAKYLITLDSVDSFSVENGVLNLYAGDKVVAQFKSL